MTPRHLVLGFLGVGCLVVGCGDNSPGTNDNNTNAPVCGNGLVEAPEECDDGGQVSGDGCSASCMTELPHWEEITPEGSPPARVGMAMAYDSGRERIVMFGGTADGTYLGDTWEFDGYEWIEVTPANSPAPRALPGIVYDEILGRIVLFGGVHKVNSAYSVLHDIWIFDGDQWQEIASTGFPTDLEWYRVIYDVARQRSILFGVDDHEMLGSYAETWAYDEPNWTMLNTTEDPPGGIYADVAYDALRECTVIIGGLWNDYQSDTKLLSDTWEFHGNDWIRIAVPVSPPARLGHSMAFDSGRGHTVLFGGNLELIECTQNTADQSTWEYDGTNWYENTTSTAPSARCFAGMAYHEAIGGIVLFSGGIQRLYPSEWDVKGDTWVYR